MRQYHMVASLDKREYVCPHKLGCGLKLWEQLASHPSTGTALVVLLASASNGQGGGDLKEGPAVIGRWRGDRIAFVGDYDDGTVYFIGAPARLGESLTGAEIYRLCHEGTEGCWTDVSEAVCAVLEAELGGKYKGSGWREFVYGDDETPAQRALKPDMLVVARS